MNKTQYDYKLAISLIRIALSLLEEPEKIQRERETGQRQRTNPKRSYHKRRLPRSNKLWTKEEDRLLLTGSRVPGRSKSSKYSRKTVLRKINKPI